MLRADEFTLVRGSDGFEALHSVAHPVSERMDRSKARPERTERLGRELDAWPASFEHADAAGEVTMADATTKRLSNLGYL